MKTIRNSGKVWLVGAGPGDPELLTIKAVRVLGTAEVVLVDDLVNPEVLVHLCPGARVIHVGKRGGCKSTPQAFIEKLLVTEAQAGRCVVRLKGGDPFVFGRGGEETAALDAAGIAWEVVSGITAGIAAPAAAGIPVTHRDAGRGVAFITGHTRDGAAVDWEALARSGLTLVIYMGIAHCADIVAGLRAGGLRADLPAAVIQHATLPQQRVVATTLARLADDIKIHHIDSPAILVIGEVADAARIAEQSLTKQATAA
ncbi:MAG: uroporphyrinogen-III C-methyltransferase [Burkholderiales bacterium]|nr:uroporphyrinogen-III C-methyltransferase [Burkholderiales bacterium]